MSKKNKDVNIYIASAQAEGSNRIGYGFTKIHDNAHNTSSKAYRLGSEKPTLDLADVMSVVKSLESLKSPSNATIYTTSSLIANAIAQPKTVPDIIKKVQKNKPLRKAWEKVEKQLQNHDEVNAVFISSNACDMLTEAQRQATLGTKLSYFKEGRDEKNYSKHTKNEMLQDALNENVIS